MKFYPSILKEVKGFVLLLIISACTIGCWTKRVVTVQSCKERVHDEYCLRCDSLVSKSQENANKGKFKMETKYYHQGIVTIRTFNIYKKKSFYNQPLYEKVEFFRNGQLYKIEEVITKDTLR
jgi:hypothetical protein